MSFERVSKAILATLDFLLRMLVRGMRNKAKEHNRDKPDVAE